MKALAVAALLVLAAAAPAAAAPAAAAASAPPEEVELPLADYLALVQKAEAYVAAAEKAEQGREKGVSEVTAERCVLTLQQDGRTAKVESLFEVLFQGQPLKKVFLPIAGYVATAVIEKEAAGGAFVKAPEASLAARAGGGAELVAPRPGRYRVRAESRLPAETDGGRLGLRLLEVAAPVATAVFDLPAELDWESSGAVLVSQEVANGRRRIELATERGAAPALVARRRFAQGEEPALVEVVALTLVQLRPEGLRRHDVLLYEVARGRLAAFEVTLPPGLEAEVAATDEGPALPIVAGGKLRVERRRQLAGAGYLVLSSTPAPQELVELKQVVPEAPVRARFLAAAASVAAEVGPRPEAAFSQVDLSDLPPILGEALGAVDLAAAWRLHEGADPAAAALLLRPLPPAPRVAATVLSRDTTTLLTVDGTLLHRETFRLAPSDLPASSFEVALPPGAALWSARVDGQPTRPLERGGALVLPILPSPGATTEIEVVAVAARAIPPGRSRLEIDLARVEAPVLEHRWRLLLPDGASYRYAGGELAPAVERPPAGRRLTGSCGFVGVVNDEYGMFLPGASVTVTGPAGELFTITDEKGRFLVTGLPPGNYAIKSTLEGFNTTIREAELREGQRRRVDLELPTGGVEETVVVTAESPLLDDRKWKRETDALERDEPAPAAELAPIVGSLDIPAGYDAEVGELKKGLVSGVKPLPITIPETGKSLVLTAILPPAHIGVSLEVKAKGK